MNILDEINKLEPELIELRRDFHQHPELGWQETRTSRIVAEYLKELGLEVEEGVSKTGVVGLLKGSRPGKTLMLRADMDALPVEEQNDFPYVSKNEGVMHACGHDGHTAILLIAAKILAKRKDEIAGNIKFVFQPNEETEAARFMIEEGVLEDPKVDAAMGLHLWTPIESGKIGIAPGAVMGGLYEFEVIIHGKGGHTSAPHLSKDPIIAGTNIIQQSQMIQTREIDPMQATIIVFGQFQAGNATNIIPEKAHLKGTIRYLYQGGRNSPERPRRRLERIVAGVCNSSGLEYEIKYPVASSPVYNDPDLSLDLEEVAAQVGGGTENLIGYRCLAGEDFGEFSAYVPSVFYFIGTGNPDKGTDYPHHHPKFDIDEDTLTTGVEMQVRSALRYLKN
ncbi:MAG: M20 metallopeptidase family protein [Bacillota bacterium]